MVSLICTNLGALLVMTWAMLGSATTYTVGDAAGWSYGIDFSDWANDKSFIVGDTLVFAYVPGAHTVNEVSVDDYQSCSTSSYLSSDASGSTTITLKIGGTHYFVCGVSDHCIGGMKLTVSVGISSTSSSSTAFPSTAFSPSAAIDSSTNCHYAGGSEGRDILAAATAGLVGLLALWGSV